MHNKPINLLLVEDDEDDYFLVRDVTDSVDRVSYEIFWCDTFEKARSALAGKRFDVALIDYRIGGKQASSS